MSSGTPDWGKLYEMGKLPKEQFYRVNGAIPPAVMNKLCDDCKKLLFPKMIIAKKEEPKSNKVTYEQKCEKCEVVISGDLKREMLANYEEHLKTHETS